MRKNIRRSSVALPSTSDSVTDHVFLKINIVNMFIIIWYVFFQFEVDSYFPWTIGPVFIMQKNPVFKIWIADRQIVLVSAICPTMEFQNIFLLPPVSIYDEPRFVILSYCVIFQISFHIFENIPWRRAPVRTADTLNLNRNIQPVELIKIFRFCNRTLRRQQIVFSKFSTSDRAR